MEKSEQELMIKFQMFEQQIQAIQQQLQAVEQAIVEMGTLNLGLDDLIGKKDNEILAPIGRGIYAKARLTSEELLVDIGEKNFVIKTIPETKEIIQNQMKKLGNIRDELNNELNKINDELTTTFNASQGHNHSHKHDHECHCGKECECEEGECDCDDECECEKN